MKKYIKPELYYEDLQLAQHIATCAFDINSAEGTCVAVPDQNFSSLLPGETIFNDAPCVFTPGIIEDFCATNGNSGWNLYNS